MPIIIKPIEDETEIEYNLRLSLEIIRVHAPDVEVIHRDYDEDEPVTGTEVIESINRLLKDLSEDRKNKLIATEMFGTIVQAGGETNIPTVTITTSIQELKRQKSIPFYRKCEIRFTPLANQ